MGFDQCAGNCVTKQLHPTICGNSQNDGDAYIKLANYWPEATQKYTLDIKIFYTMWAICELILVERLIDSIRTVLPNVCVDLGE